MRLLADWFRFLRLTRYHQRQGHNRITACRLARMA